MRHPHRNLSEGTGPGDETLAADDQAVLVFDPAATISAQSSIPIRYQIKENDKGRYLTCSDAPNLAVYIERGFSVSGSGARKYPEHTLFLDGAAQGEPFIDSGRKVHNLDHHEGCVRSFTLATCEQAMVMVLKGLDLDGERWTIYTSEPDLDTVLAVWVLLNHRKVGSAESPVRGRVMPLIRLQGVIDAHGFELAELTGFPDGLQRETQALIDRLRAKEVSQRESGAWSSVDFLDYTLGLLIEIDHEVYDAADFSDDANVEELERVPLVGDRFAVACRAAMGIYEVEQHLRGVHGDRVGLIFLERSPGAWTLRQVDPFLPHGLGALYDRLNLLDPVVKGDNRWGGSTEIGGSPRRTGSGLELQEITEVCRWVFRPPTQLQKAGASVAGLVTGVAGVAVAALAVLPVRGTLRIPGLMASADVTMAFAVCLAAIACGLAVLVGRRIAPALAGLGRPAAGPWPIIAPVMIACAYLGGGWGAIAEVGGVVATPSVSWWYAVWLFLGAAALELLMRGVVHGWLADTHAIMIPAGRWFVSLPLVLTASASATLTLVFFLPTPAIGELLSSDLSQWALWVVAALVMGVASGLVRERSASVWPAAVFHATAVVAVWVACTVFL